MAIYCLLAMLRNPVWGVSSVPYFNHLADAFLHGQLHLRLLPASTHDLVHYAGRYYLYWPPFPAVILMPFVAIFGVNFSDILFTASIAALNVAMVAQLLRKATLESVIQTSDIQRALLVSFFALGTVHITLSTFGQVWQTSQQVALLCTLAAYLAAISKKGRTAFFITGLCIAGAALTRSHLLFVGIWPAYYLIWKHRPHTFKQLADFTLAGVLPVMIAIVAFAIYNYLRFGNITNMGYAYHQMHPIFVDDYQKYGAFNLHYLQTNFYYQYIFYPYLSIHRSLLGGSLFLLSPVFIAAFWGIGYGRPRMSVLFLALTILIVDIPILLLMGTGWVQFGPRYTLDFTTPLLLLSAMGLRRWPDSLLAILVSISVVHYVGGTLLLLLKV